MAKHLRSLPLQVGLIALLFYSITLSHGVTFESLPLTAKIAGWDWLPMTRQPLLWLCTLPLRLLVAARTEFFFRRLCFCSAGDSG